MAAGYGEIGYSLQKPLNVRSKAYTLPNTPAYGALAGLAGTLIGESLPGTEESTAKWRIYWRYQSGTQNLVINWANGSGQMGFSWTLRETYDYSK